MFIFLTIIILFAAILLAVIVVIQNSKGGGLAAGFSSANNMMGVRKTTDFLEKTTWWLTGIIIALSIISVAFLPKNVSKVDTFNEDVKKSIQVQNEALPNLGDKSTELPMPQPATPSEPEQTPQQ